MPKSLVYVTGSVARAATPCYPKLLHRNLAPCVGKVLTRSGSHIIERYKSLADIECGFRVLKNDIDIAPVFHRLPERIRAHALICFLALVLYRVMRMRLKAHGSAHSPETTLELLRRLQKHRVQLGEQHLTGIGKTSPQQLDLCEALGINQPG